MSDFSALSPETLATNPARPATTRRLAWPGLVSALLLLLASVSATDASHVVANLGDFDQIDLPIGATLFAALEGADAGSSITLTLRDTSGQLIAHTEAVADIDGVVGPVELWKRTGVVGCDPATEPDPLIYRFARFEEAEAALLDSALVLQAEDSKGPVADSLVRFVSPEAFFYFSDGSGCMRTVFDPWDDLYVSVSKGQTTPGPMRLFLIDRTDEVPCVGDTLEEIRQEHQDKPQHVTLGPGQWSVLAWLGKGDDFDIPGTCRHLYAVARPAAVSNSFLFEDDDTFVQQGPPVPCPPDWAHYSGSGAQSNSWKPIDKGPSCPPEEE